MNNTSIAERFKVTKKIELFFIGNEFYHSSGSKMSSIYVSGSYERFDWGFVNLLLQEGKCVYIRPASKEEIDWANKEIQQYLKPINRKNLQ